MKKAVVLLTAFLLMGCANGSSEVSSTKGIPSSAEGSAVEGENTEENIDIEAALDQYICVLSYVGNEKDGLGRSEYTYEFDESYQITKCIRTAHGVSEEIASLENEFDIQKQYEYYKKGCSVLKYDEQGRLIHFDNDSCEDGGGSSDFEYDANGNLVMVMTNDARPYHYEYMTIRDYLAKNVYELS